MIVLFDFKRQFVECVVNELMYFVDLLRCLFLYLRNIIIEYGDVKFFCVFCYLLIEVGVVDEYDGVWLIVGKLFGDFFKKFLE